MIGLIILTLFLAAFIYYLFFNNGLPEWSVTVPLNKEMKALNISPGEEVNIWPKPNSKEIFVYAKGTGGGQGKLCNLSGIYYKHAMEGEIDGKVINTTKDSITIRFTITKNQ